MVEPRVKPFFGTTTPIRYPNGKGGGTGFFFNHEGETYLISNRHVFRPGEFTPLEANIWLRDVSGLKARPQTVDLYNENGSERWYDHPRSEEIDLGVLPLNARLSSIDKVMQGVPETGSLAFTAEHILPDAITLNGSEVIVGYPGEFIDRNTYFPVKRNAVIASPYGVRHDEKPCFVTDARMHDGTSGSPILLENPILHREGFELREAQEKSVYLLGIHSATYYDHRDKKGEDYEKWKYDLNLGWYPELIVEIIDSL